MVCSNGDYGWLWRYRPLVGKAVAVILMFSGIATLGC